MELRKKHIDDVMKSIEYSGFLFPMMLAAREVGFFFKNRRFTDQKYITFLFEKYQDYKLNLANPKTLNEKLQWLKINDRKEYYSTFADKLGVREYLSKTFGENYLIPMVFSTPDYRELTPINLPDYPVVIKTNHGFGNSTFIRDKSKINWIKIRADFRKWLKTNYYYFEREWQYKNISPLIVVEKMLLDSSGHIPNDYKLNFIEGKLEFIYVSVDREGINKRNIYDPDWNPMFFTWARKGKEISNIRGPEINPPKSLSKMIEFGSVISKLFKYVRVDFYDVDGELFFGEITQCHGGGFDQLLPYEYDLLFGSKIILGNNLSI